jgi:PAS domain S-box-containing protein
LQSLKILEVNDIAQVEYGYSREELLSMSVKDLRDPKEHGRIESFARDFMESDILKKSGIWEHRKKNGELLILDISSHKIDYKGNAAILAIHKDITEKVRLQEKLEEEKMMKQKEITEAMIQVQEKERYEMSTELHDNVNQQLTVAMMYIASAQQKNPDEGGLLKQASDFIMHCIEEIRNLSQTLVTPMIKHFGLSKAVEGLLDDISRVNAIQIDLIADTFFEDDIKYDFKLSVFRIVQELVNNTLKHSKAKNITLELLRKENQIYLSIQDDGIGFDINQQRKGIGLHNIVSRSDLYNGIVNINTEPGKGCTVEITFPIENTLQE